MKPLAVMMILSVVFFSTKGVAGDMKEITLPKPKTTGKVSVEESIAARRSVRSYGDNDLTAEQISQLLWSCQGITNNRGLRAAPSAGARYPLEVYVVKKDGLYRYVPKGHKLEKKSEGDLRKELAAAALGQGFVAEAPVSIVITAVYERVSSGYGKRGVKYTDIEVGHVAENVHLQAVALGLASVPVGAFNDEAVSRLLELPKDQVPVYIIPVGYEK